MLRKVKIVYIMSGQVSCLRGLKKNPKKYGGGGIANHMAGFSGGDFSSTLSARCTQTWKNLDRILDLQEHLLKSPN